MSAYSFNSSLSVQLFRTPVNPFVVRSTRKSFLRIEVFEENAQKNRINTEVWITGTVEPITDNDLTVYPNPGADILQVSIPEFTGQQATITVYSMDGKIVMQKTAATNRFQLDIHTLPAGNYLLLVGSTNHTYRKSIIRN